MLYNSNSWFTVFNADIESFEQVDTRSQIQNYLELQIG